MVIQLNSPSQNMFRLNAKALRKHQLRHIVRDARKGGYVRVVVFILTLIGAASTFDPAVYCGRGPGGCTVFLCNNTAGGTSFPCVFAPRNRTQKVYFGADGQWNTDDIRYLNITEFPCSGNNCCMTSIAATAPSPPPPPVNVKIQFLDGDNLPHTPATGYKVVVKLYEKCVQDLGPFPAYTHLNSNPTPCLDLTIYCNFTTTTIQSSVSTATTTQPEFSPPTPTNILGLEYLEHIRITNITTPVSGHLPQISFSIAAYQTQPSSYVEAWLIRDTTNTLAQYETQQDEGNYKVLTLPAENTPLLSIAAYEWNVTLPSVLNFTIHHTGIGTTPDIDINNDTLAVTRIKSVQFICAFLNTTSDMFETRGCHALHVDTNSVTCHCNHTTLFAVLLSIKAYSIPATAMLISYITESISIISLIITTTTLVLIRKNVRGDRIFVQINLCIAVACLHISTFFQDLAINNNHMCELVTVATHGFLLATGAWMLLEGLTALVVTTNQIMTISKKNPKKIALMKLIIGWVVPAAYAVVTAMIGIPTGRYMDKTTSNQYTRCWISNQHGSLQASVIFPMATICTINLLIAVRFIWFMNKLRGGPVNRGGNEIRAKDFGALVRVFFMLFPALGFGIVFAMLTSIEPYEASVVFMYINIFANGLQGFFLLLVYCVLNNEVREVLSRKWNQAKNNFSATGGSQKIGKSNTSTHSTSQHSSTYHQGSEEPAQSAESEENVQDSTPINKPYKPYTAPGIALKLPVPVGAIEFQKRDGKINFHKNN